jgi:hypothetical protein
LIKFNIILSKAIEYSKLTISLLIIDYLIFSLFIFDGLYNFFFSKLFALSLYLFFAQHKLKFVKVILFTFFVSLLSSILFNHFIIFYNNFVIKIIYDVLNAFVTFLVFYILSTHYEKN